MKRICVLLLLVMITSSLLFAGPFGLEFGWNKDEMVQSGVKIVFEKPVGYDTIGYVIEPINKHKDFSLYLVYIDSEYGIYRIDGMSEGTTSPTKLLSLYDKICSQLSNVYGEPISRDYTKPDSIWSADSDLISAIYYKDREKTSFWFPTAKTQEDIYFISYGIITFDGYEGYSRLEYYSLAWELVEEKQEKAETAVL